MSNIDFLEQHKNRNLAMIRPPRQFRTYEPMFTMRALNDSNEHAQMSETVTSGYDCSLVILAIMIALQQG